MTESTLRQKVGASDSDKWPGFAWPGGYPIMYITNDGGPICADCMNRESQIHFGGDADGWRIDGAGVYWEGPAMCCAHCNTVIESAYGDPESVTE